MKRFFDRLLPAAFVMVAMFFTGLEFAWLFPHAESYNPAWWKPLVSLAIGLGVFFTYFWPPRRERNGELIEAAANVEEGGGDG